MRRKKAKKLRQRRWKFLFLFLIPLLFVLLLVLSKNSNPTPTSTVPTITPAPTPIPSPTPTPTPTIPPGYCLQVPVLVYHHIQPHAQAATKGQLNISVDNGTFDLQMAYLQSSGYNTITARQLIDALLTHNALPPKSILITLDDGYKDAYEYAFPIFKKYNITANLMISTGLLEGADYMSWDNINEMARSGRVYFTNHTWSHYALGRGSEEKIRYEIETADKQIEANTGQPVDIFTYPYGSFTDQSIAILKQLGYTGAFSTIPGSYQCDSIIMVLRRTRIGNSPLPAYGL